MTDAIVEAIGQASRGERIRPREDTTEDESEYDARRRRLMNAVDRGTSNLKGQYWTTHRLNHCRRHGYVMGQFNYIDSLEYSLHQRFTSSLSNDHSTHTHTHALENHTVGGSSGSNGNQ